MEDILETITNILFAIVETILLIAVLTSHSFTKGVTIFAFLFIIFILMIVYNIYQNEY